jgi:hypothetical protein
LNTMHNGYSQAAGYSLMRQLRMKLAVKCVEADQMITDEW